MSWTNRRTGPMVLRMVSVLDRLGLDAARDALAAASRHVEEGDGPEQVLLFDLAYIASVLEAASVMVDYAEGGEIESKLARVFIAEALHDVRTYIDGREHLF